LCVLCVVPPGESNALLLEGYASIWRKAGGAGDPIPLRVEKAFPDQHTPPCTVALGEGAALVID
jgi:hypothetical protein